ncbi:hypothetical protein [Hyphomicrobium sp. 2TAF46]|uniref:hypothetical protein n=1 Tax=Hyphomicrobium sp. 2TAF46 TaxID=3233019 RepID=UPI003F91A387
MTHSAEGWNAGLWLAVIVSGIYHGINPGMGWPLAVSAGLMERRQAALFRALGILAGGHFAAMAIILLPFSLLTTLVSWSRQIQISASLLVIGFGVFLFFNRRHPRALARIPPAKLALWSFAIAMAHGAGLMLLPIYLGLCSASQPLDPGHEAAIALASHNLTLALGVAAIHTAAMIAAGGIIAWSVYRYLGLQILSKLWINLDAFWALSLIAVGLSSIVAFIG